MRVCNHMKYDEKLQRIENKVDTVVEHIGNINITLAKQHVSLDEHIRRTALLEQQVKPIERHVNMVNGVLKFIGFISLLLGIATSALKLLGKI